MKKILENLKSFFKSINPSQFPPWQIGLLIGIILACLSLVESMGENNSNPVKLIANLSWLCLIVAIGWRTNQKPFIFRDISLSPWITAVFICGFLYENFIPDMKYFAIVIWPLISVCLAALFELFKDRGKIDRDRYMRKRFTFLILIHILLSCLLNFHFIVQNWLEEYPSAQGYDVSKSAFVVRFKSPSLDVSRGEEIMEFIESRMERELSNRPLEISVFQMQSKLQTLISNAMEDLPNLKENKLWEWQIQQIRVISEGYEVEFQLTWQGLISIDEMYSLSKTCQIQPEIQTTNSSSSRIEPETVNIIRCSPIERKEEVVLPI